MPTSPTRRTRLGAAAGIVGAAAAFAVVLGAGPVPSVFQLAGAHEDVSGNCDEAEHAGDPTCVDTATPIRSDDDGTSTTVDDRTTSTTVDDRTTTSVPGGPTNPADEVRTIDAAGAGTVIVAVDGGNLRLVAATPAPGWRAEVEQGTGREVEVDFRSGSQRVQVNVEIEDGQVRERVRVRDDAAGTDVRTEDGTAVRDDSDDSSGHGSDDSVEDDHTGSGHGTDDAVDDDHSGSGHGGDDGSADDDHSGSGHGSDD